MAKLVHQRGYLHHFNIGLQSINRSHHFLDNICRQLVDRYALPYTDLPPDATRDGRLLNRLLAEAAGKLAEGEKMVLAIDALDEVDGGDLGADANLLHLPDSLPDGVYVVATSRRFKEMPLRVMNLVTFDLEANSTDNREDAARYVKDNLKDAAMQAAISSWETDEARVVDALVGKSEGNFMYLRHVLPAIRDGNLTAGGLDELPQGLLNFYRHHWRQMRGQDEKTFDALYRPVVCILATVKEAVSLDQIHHFTRIDPNHIQRAIYAWYEFLHMEIRRENRKACYRVYHTLFQEYLFKEIEPGLIPYHKMIADYYLEKIGIAGEQVPEL